jgi:hypothetical protein
MPESTYRGRRAHRIETEDLRVTVLVEGGHIAEIADKRSGVNPLWTPPWPSIEPSSFDPVKHPEYGADAESKLLAGIMGHNLCLDLFGGPSEAEAAAGLTVHGEGSVARYDVASGQHEITARASMPMAQLRFERRLRLRPGSRAIAITETVENVSGLDRPIAWTQHVTLGPPFLVPGSTEFRAPATRSKTIETDFSNGKGQMKIGAEFDWPHAPRIGGGTLDLRVYSSAPVSAAFCLRSGGYLLFSDIPSNAIMKWAPAGELSVFRKPVFLREFPDGVQIGANGHTPARPPHRL